MAAEQENKPAVVRGPGGRLVKGTASPNPGGRPRALTEIQQMLNREHRNVANMTEVFAKLKELALRGDKGDAAYMKLYLERVLGPVKDLDELENLLADAPPEVVTWLREVLN